MNELVYASAKASVDKVGSHSLCTGAMQEYTRCTVNNVVVSNASENRGAYSLGDRFVLALRLVDL